MVANVGVLIVTLTGRPVESYLKIVGSNGCLIADFVRGTAIKFPGPGTSAISAILNPYIHAKQLISKTTLSFAHKALKKQSSYPGLLELIHLFYESIIRKIPPPTSYASIIDTVKCCQEITQALTTLEDNLEKKAKLHFERIQKNNPLLVPNRVRIIVKDGLVSR